MTYIILCGGEYKQWGIPRQLTKITGETLVGRTIRLLNENGISNDDIAIAVSTPKEVELYLPYEVEVVVNGTNDYVAYGYDNCDGYWCNCFMRLANPCTYLFGDVVFSPDAIKTIVETETDDIEFFASAPPFAYNYPKTWAEPFAFKVVDQDHLSRSVFFTKSLAMAGKFKRHPIAWEFWQVVKWTELNKIDYTNYTVINDYTCDIDNPDDISKFEGVV